MLSYYVKKYEMIYIYIYINIHIYIYIYIYISATVPKAVGACWSVVSCSRSFTFYKVGLELEGWGLELEGGGVDVSLGEPKEITTVSMRHPFSPLGDPKASKIPSSSSSWRFCMSSWHQDTTTSPKIASKIRSWSQHHRK